MAGIYIHIPFCKTRCVYCGFFSTTTLEKRRQYVDALIAELHDRRSYLRGEDVDTIYFGGGTPSQLDAGDVERILASIYNIYNVRAKAEVTLEGNPDDMSESYLHELLRIGVNRLSMGVQTFDDGRLRFLNRRHTSQQAIDAVRCAQRAGFSNISIDLMFGFPCQTLDEWKRDVDMAMSLGVQHLSAYSLMYEEGTLLGRMLDDGRVKEVSEEMSLSMYEHLVDTLKANGFEHYEISNFALPGCHSRHNSSYWRGIAYLGVGAGAHSFDGECRQYNVESLDRYLTGAAPEKEFMTEDERYDEFVFTGLRTREGISLAEMETRFGAERKDYCIENARRHIASGRLVMEGDTLRLSREGLFVSNDIMSDLMLVESDIE